MGWLTALAGKRFAQLVSKSYWASQDIDCSPQAVKRYHKPWYEQGIPNGVDIGTSAILLVMVWCVCLVIILSDSQLCTRAFIDVYFMMVVGYVLLLTPTNMLLLKGKRLGVILYMIALLCDIFVGAIALICCVRSYIYYYDMSNVIPFFIISFLLFSIRFLLNSTSFSDYVDFYRIKRVVLGKEC
ncbi:hypothetical protein MKU92_003224 [Salmonella enterica]|nr:hypothetical protein [Salmonella enterica]